ncbi:CRISPR-associated endoribonuclease Cas6 [Maledivibacter halophilus]|uniref:CRISPR-associated endoribonuclease n=1 Tax=Maledivibacter halophilus TaxID=36842 RepID=A0A1T5JDL8_9FIRM|nr:CRISPR-associated endoribonuclease Cas6 [Maledivibacter halophilus]SKC49436.1 CRISPR-associated endoribonuclease Cas6 [Maledivibacter halophilus]
MRLICQFEFKGKLTLPIHYNHMIQGLIYNSLTDEALRSFLHEVGFKNGKRKYKMFTYSRLLGKYEINKKDKTIMFESPIKLHISSLVDDFVNNLSTTLFKSNKLFLGNKEIHLASINTEYPIFKNREAKIEMLSPIVTYSSIKIDGKNKTVYYSPLDSIFSEKIKENLIRKYTAIHGEEPEDDEFVIKYVGTKEPKKSVIRYHNTIINGYNGRYLLKGNPDLIRLAYFVGIGSKNSQGFGCFRLLK